MMKTIWYGFEYFLFTSKFNMVDFVSIYWLSNLAVRHENWAWMLLLIPVLIISTRMERKMRQEDENNA
jgi:hypothetical protein